MPDADRPRRRLDDLSQSTRIVIAVVGFAAGLLLVLVGARSCETSLNDGPTGTGPTDLTTTGPRG